jgi:cation diffusion facilitator family transporter
VREGSWPRRGRTWHRPDRSERVNSSPAAKAIRATQTGLLVNAALVVIKLIAGIVGNTYALVADAIESAADVFASLIVWGGLSIAAVPADEDYPFGYGKAEALAAAVVSMLLLGAGGAIAFEAVREIRTPHNTPAAWTLIVLVAVMLVKLTLSHRVEQVGATVSSTAVKADAAHHLSDAITSGAAFIGISIAVVGSRVEGGSGWESADDWAALVASGVIAFNGITMLRSAMHDLMDRMPAREIVDPVRAAALSVEGVLALEKLHVRKAGLGYQVTVHVQADPNLSLHDAHALGGKVKWTICDRASHVQSVLVHMEPFEAANAHRLEGRGRGTADTIGWMSD